ncbi:ATP-dependent DNA helicase DinG [Comamonas endophytica]|uniref:ATP-dependent DNA helicase DinG n=1 Tax=Comamonas endophytica TaxID=2949090 RepID=A0ABY6GDM3_9BURK|nr:MULTISPECIES: ATP-dependent DNA helicase DinG [unclassified Acidovorax]MCD2512438.1 ATP-dependent DNA helicase DinG [Acidovorax sp. D4N7]UYG53191.1 ATP-dependent DNA helicase DinG [Acidovorax sp. 5MLIR]
MSQQKWAQMGLESFDEVVASIPGFRSREGQRRMAGQVASTFGAAQLGKVDDDAVAPERAIAVVQAGTGVGKSLAYSVPAITLALARGTRVLISTATVALQEQLVNKDLPALAAQLEQPFKFALAKGRGRFVCKLKLERLAGTGESHDDTDDLFAEEEAATRNARPAQEREARMQFYASMADAMATGVWDGDRDSLATPPEPEAWSPVAAESSSCTGKHCPVFDSCTYYERRKSMVAAQVIVANHDLLLSSLGARLLPDLDNCLLVLDEAHHLPATALSQFACALDLSRLGWIDKLASRALRVGTLLEVEEVADVPGHSSQLRQTLQDLARLVMDFYGDELKARKDSWGPARVRAARGMLPEALLEPLAQASHHANGFLDALRAISKALRAEIRDKPEEARRLSTLYAQVGALAPRLESVYDTAQLLLQQPAEDEDTKYVPNAKWFTLETDGEFIVVKAHASPLLPGATLRQHLWSQVRGAVLTSATLTSCGQFDFFLRESGLHGDAAVTTLEVPSPFDYASQGIFVAAETHADPRQASAFTNEMVDALLHDLARVESGALVLFTSREQMRLAVDALSTAMRANVLVQTAMPRAQLLALHRERVARGEVSIIFGMQSFGEGLDLPGAQCESLFITKLPFAPPDDPVGEARAEWLRSAGRDPFSELVVPATAIRLAQWVGRAIRTEEDRAFVYCYDKRLVRTSYGQRLLNGLPPFALEKRPPR